MLAEPRPLLDRLKPPFLIHPAMLKALQALVPALSQPARRDLVEQIVSLPPVTDQLNAQSWARVVAALPSSCWTDSDVAGAAARAGEHQTALEYALLASVAPHLPQMRTRLLDEAASDRYPAIDALGDVGNLPPERAAELLPVTLGHLAGQQDGDLPAGWGGFGGTDWAWWLAALNLNFPDIADWNALLDHLRDPTTHPARLTATLRLLVGHINQIPPDRLPQLRDAVDQLPQRHLHPWGQQASDDTIRWASAVLHNATGDDPVPQLLAGTPSDRSHAALLIGRRTDDALLPVLTTLAYDHDHDTDVRAAAAHAAGRWAAQHANHPVHQLLDHLLTDPGTRIAHHLTTGLRTATDPSTTSRPHQAALLAHRSARVGQAAQHLVPSNTSSGCGPLADRRRRGHRRDGRRPDVERGPTVEIHRQPPLIDREHGRRTTWLSHITLTSPEYTP